MASNERAWRSDRLLQFVLSVAICGSQLLLTPAPDFDLYAFQRLPPGVQHGAFDGDRAAGGCGEAAPVVHNYKYVKDGKSA
jgi:hypothetical protein